MSGVASIHRGKQKHPAESATAPIWVNPTGNGVTIIPGGAGNSTGVELVASAGATGGIKVDSGIATFVSGAVAVTTKLSTVASFQTTIPATGFATGATEITNAVISGAITPTGGATVVNLQGYRLFTTTASASGTSTVHWFAIGT